MQRVNKALLVFFNGKSNAGGAERMVQYLDEYLMDRGLETEIIDEGLLLNTFWGRQYKRIFKYRHFEKRKAIYMARFASIYLWMHKGYNQIIFSNGESTPFFPVDFVMNNGCYHVMEQDYGRKEKQLSRMANLQRLACLRARHVITVAEKVKADLINYYHVPEEKISVVTNPVNRDYFKPLPKPESAIKTVAYIGRLEVGKGLKQLQELAGLIEMNQQWRLLIACNNPINTELFTSYRHTSVVVGLGIENINEEAYSKADLVFFPSLSESFGMVTIEALSAGVPVIATATGIVPELAARDFPGVYLLPSLLDHTILNHFDRIIDSFKTIISKEGLHAVTQQEFGITVYRRRLDEVIGPQI